MCPKFSALGQLIRCLATGEILTLSILIIDTGLCSWNHKSSRIALAERSWGCTSRKGTRIQASITGYEVISKPSIVSEPLDRPTAVQYGPIICTHGYVCTEILQETISDRLYSFVRNYALTSITKPINPETISSVMIITQETNPLKMPCNNLHEFLSHLGQASLATESLP